MSGARGHDVERLFDEAIERQKTSGHPAVNLQRPGLKIVKSSGQ